MSAVAFLSALGITNQPVFGLIVSGPHGAITIAWKNDENTYVMDRNVRHYDITDLFQALQFVLVLPRLAHHGKKFHDLFQENALKQLEYKPRSKLAQQQHSAEDTRLAADQQTERKQR